MNAASHDRTTFEFPSPEAAWGFAQQARELGHRVDLPERVNLFSHGSHAAVWIGALIGGALLGLIGAFAENFALALPRLGPIFAAPIGAPTVLFAVLGGSAGALIGGLLTLRPVAAHTVQEGHLKLQAQHGSLPMQPVLVAIQSDDEQLGHVAMEWGGLATPDAAPAERA